INVQAFRKENSHSVGGVTGPTSQIPGLCQTATESAAVERVSGRRVGIFETDSDYVKLAKQGGHKGEPTNHRFKITDQFKKLSHGMSWWFCAFSGSKASSPDSQMKAGRRPLAAPFGTDNNSSWERETDSFSHGKEKMPLHLLLLPLFQFLSQLSFIFHLRFSSLRLEIASGFNPPEGLCCFLGIWRGKRWLRDCSSLQYSSWF
uniref:Uncharacterized protein n=1 Tax=Poecilia reticulata TaxID=8081 RepID=A0A3P9QF23_POERE